MKGIHEEWEEGYVEIPVLEINQKLGSFFVGKLNANLTNQICSADPRTSIDGSVAEYVGLQRFLNPDRVSELRKYTQTSDASFPNSIILSMEPGCYSYDSKKRTLYVKRDMSSCAIIDGQHRLAGFSPSKGKEFELILALIPELSIEQQAYLFTVINTKAVKLNPSLSQDLYAVAKIKIPEKIVHTIVKKLNTDPESPFYRLIKPLGRKEDGLEDAILSQSTFSRRIVELIYDPFDRYEIRSKLLDAGNDRFILRSFYSEKKLKKYPFWKAYVSKEEYLIYKSLFNFFYVIRELLPRDWGSSDSILTKTTGYSALINFFKKLVVDGLSQGDLSIDYFRSCIPLSIQNLKFTSDVYPPGGKGERSLTKDLLGLLD